MMPGGGEGIIITSGNLVVVYSMTGEELARYTLDTEALGIDDTALIAGVRRIGEEVIVEAWF